MVLSSRSHAPLESVLAECLALGAESKGVPCDLSIPSEVRRLARAAESSFGGLDVLLNNAAVSVKKPFHETSDPEWAAAFQVNAMAPFILCRECLPALQRSDWATIINMGSVVGLKGYEGQAAYGASKHALLGFTKVLAREVQPLGIRVHAINPGAVATEMVETMRPDLNPDALIDPEDIADWVLFLLEHRHSRAVIDDIHLRRASGEPWF